MEVKKVVIVEDDKMLSTLSTMYLKGLGYELEGVFQSGKDVFEHCKKKLPDIILMDIHIEGELNGIDTARNIFNEYNIPVIFVTSDAEPQTIENIISFPCFGILLKPIDRNTLQEALNLAVRDDLKQQLIASGISNQTPVVICADMEISYVNEKAASMLSMKKDEDILGKNMNDYLMTNGGKGDLQCSYDDSEAIVTKKAKIVTKGQKIINVDIKSFPFIFKNVKSNRFVMVATE